MPTNDLMPTLLPGLRSEIAILPYIMLWHILVLQNHPGLNPSHLCNLQPPSSQLYKSPQSRISPVLADFASPTFIDVILKH